MSIPREHRLRKHAEFELVYRNGQRHFSPVLTAFYLLRESTKDIAEGAPGTSRTAETILGSRVGITVGRMLGKSTARNRIKRRVRAAVTQNLARITRPIDVVINPKKTVQEIDFQMLCSEISRAFDVIDKKAVRADTKQNSRGGRNSESRHKDSETKTRRLAAREK